MDRRIRESSVYQWMQLAITPLLLVTALTGNALAAQKIRPANRQSTLAVDIEPVIVGAGDIAGCDSDGDEQTAALLDTIEGTVFTLGDNAYENGTLQEFTDCYGPSWGRHKERTYPVAGNHDYANGTSNAEGYFAYFGAAAGDPEKGYYSYTVGSTAIYVLNSQCTPAGGCGENSPQAQWLKAALEADPHACTIAMWHHPPFNSGQYGNQAQMKALEQILFAHGTDVIITSHAHDYERFLPQDPQGNFDIQQGMTYFVVGR